MNSTKRIISIVAVIFVLTLSISIPLTVIYAGANNNFNVELDGDGNVMGEVNDYYCEITRYDSNDMFNKAMASRTGFFTNLTVTSSDENVGKYVSGLSKKVWVSETRKGNTVVDSHLMTIEEMQSIERKTEAQSVTVGTDNDDYYYLELFLKVMESDGQYNVTAKATWENKAVYGGKETAEESREDIMVVTWGGEKYLERQNFSFSGKHHDGSALTARRTVSNAYGAMEWRFTEKTWFWGTMMKYATANITLKSTANPKIGKRTNVRLTYIHTYQSVDLDVSIGVVGDEFAATVKPTKKDKNWLLEIDVPGLVY